MPPNHPMSVWGNEKTMNLNNLVLTNIQSSPYFKVNLFELKTYHEVIDEIYYKVSHLEPWEKGSRKTAGQTGMCGGVRGVGAGGIVSSAFCLLYKLYTLKLTKKQVIGLLTHRDSPYIRGLGFMYIRYTQPPADLWPWFEDYLDDEEEIDVKAGGGHIMTIGEMLRQWLVKLEWYATLFPRIPVPIEKDLAIKLKGRPVLYHQPEPEPEHIPDNELSFGEAERRGGREDDRAEYGRHADFNGRAEHNHRGDNRSEYNGRGDNNNGRAGSHSQGTEYRGSRGRSPSPPRHRRPSPSLQRSSASRHSPPQRSSASRHSPPHRSSDYATSFERDLARERERQQRDRDRDRDQRRSRSPRDKKERRSHSRDRKDKDRNRRSRSRDRKERDRRSTSHTDRKEKQGRKSRSRERDRKESSGHKRSHKDKKDKHRDRDEKSHKHKNREKERR